MSAPSSRPTPRIDMHAHFYGGGLVEALLARSERPCLRERPGGALAMVAMNGEFPFTSDHFDIATGLAQMDAQGLTHRLLTFPGALGLDVLPANEAREMIAGFNDHLAGLRAASGGRIFGLAGLPLADIDAAAQEVRRIRRDLGLPGIILPSDYFNSVAEAKTLAPVLAAANETGCHVMLHPGLKVATAPPAPPADFAQYRTSAVALQAQATQTVLTLILSDIQDLWPRLSFQVVNLGGTIPFIFERMEAIARHRTPDHPFPTARLGNLWYDCASLGPRALEAAVKVLGAERIFLGSDYPIFTDDPFARTLAPADVEPEAKRKIEGGNAFALLERLLA
ncbi:MAG: amidohydrolase family protein [Paracoccaceae bacterium]